MLFTARLAFSLITRRYPSTLRIALSASALCHRQSDLTYHRSSHTQETLTVVPLYAPIRRASTLATTTTTTMTTETTPQQHKSWASNPFKLISDTGLHARSDVPHDHYVVKFTKDMALVHNLVLRGLNAAYNQCLSVTPGTQAAQDFLIFNQCVFEMLKSHHDMEEEKLFPALEKALGQPGAMETNVAEHHDFHDGLMHFHDYVFNTEADKYDGSTLHSIIESFGFLVEKHLHNEIASLYDLHVIESNTLKALWNDIEKNYQPNFDKYRYVPFPTFLPFPLSYY